MSKDKCSNCGSTKSKTFWDYDDGSVLCDDCESEKKRNSGKELVPPIIKYILFGILILVVIASVIDNPKSYEIALSGLITTLGDFFRLISPIK